MNFYKRNGYFKMKPLKETIMERDGLCEEEVDEMIAMAKEAVLEGEDPAEVLHEQFGLEPDYLFDII